MKLDPGTMQSADDTPISDYSVVNYYTCQNCGHTWTSNKQDTSITTDVTPLLQKPSDRQETT